MSQYAENTFGSPSEESAASAVEEQRAPEYRSELARLADEAKNGAIPPKVSVRTLLSWFDAQRRGSFIVWLIRKELERLGIQTEPDFNSVWIDSAVSLVPTITPEAGAEQNITSATPEATDEVVHAPKQEVAGVDQPLPFVGGAIEDPTYRIGKLDAANKQVVSVAPNHTIKQAITLMLMHGFSQLPVMQGDRDVKGILTWENIGGRLALGNPCKEARECMTSPQIISSEQSLFAAIETIAQFQYVLIQAPDRRITGIVTSTDLSQQFQQLTEPFLLLSEIEQHIRSLIVDKFTKQELQNISDPSDQERAIISVADLTMGEYIRLLENPANWDRLGIGIDRSAFIEQVKAVKRIRNDIMHFDPDPLGPSDLQLLRQFALFMQSLRVFA